MPITAGIDVGSGAIKAVVLHVEGDSVRVLADEVSRIRRRDVSAVVDDVFGRAVRAAGVDELHYVATTGEGEDVPYATGHFYGMTTHARGALFLDSRARTVLDVGALHTRAVIMDERGKVTDYKMTSQCASGSGQFLENIARYLGITLSEVGELSLTAAKPENVSSICAVLAETDVINMVSRGISAPDILRGIHDSMAGRYAQLIRRLNAQGVVFVSGGLASDVGLRKALQDALDKEAAKKGAIELETHPLAIQAGSIGAAIWGAVRYETRKMERPWWTSKDPIPMHRSSSAS
ncbi:2-hydroxyglutaryl-CoA dehydratase [Deltaproteobacteria bacterium]|nr:2-hydroxyglutaryl-CoA dehydratase [Deltaproteobacteria bacterium]